MKICLDLRTAGNGRHGIARYGIELARALQTIDSPHRLFLLTPPAPRWEWLHSSDASLVPCSAKPYRPTEQWTVPLVLARLRPDIYHCPTYACPLLCPVPTVFDIHDLLPLEYPRDFSRTLRLYHRSFVRLAAKRARRIVTHSSYAFSSICRRLSVLPHKVRVIHEGGDHVKEQRVSAEDEIAYRKINPGDLDYFLSIANPRPHKNILFAIRCLLGSETLRRKRVRYVLVGQQHPYVYDYVRARDREGRVRFAGEISEGLLCLLYKRTTALLCPSRGEGFCLPAVEAMQFGLPVIAAQDGALPEVLGRAGILLPLENATAWQDAFERVHASRRQGSWDPSPVLEQAGRFSWARAATETVALYEEIQRQG